MSCLIRESATRLFSRTLRSAYKNIGRALDERHNDYRYPAILKEFTVIKEKTGKEE
jgi:hypothetical protein